MINSNKIKELLEHSRYYLVNKSYDLLLQEYAAIDDNYDNCDEEFEIQCIRLLIKSLSVEYDKDPSSELTTSLYLKLAKLINISYLDDYEVDLELSYSNLDIIILNSYEDFQDEIDAIIISINNLQEQINNLDLETSFIELIDTPESYENQAGKVPIVNETEDGLEFSDFPEPTPPILTEDIPVSNNELGIDLPYTFTQGMSLTEAWKKLVQKVFYPTLTNPSFSITNNAGLREIGQIPNYTITFTFNRGSIVLQGVTQGQRAGEAVSYNFSYPGGNYSGINNVTGVTGSPVTQGINTIQGTVTYNQGPQPLDSNGQPFNTPYPAGTSPLQLTSFEGVYPLFATTVNLTTSTKQALVSMINGNNIQINLISELSGGGKQFFEIPEVWLIARPLQSARYFNSISGQFDIISDLSEFNITNTTQVIQGNTINYKRYTYTGIDRGAVQIRLIF